MNHKLWLNWPVKQRHNVQSIPFIFICHFVSAPDIVLRDLFKVDRVLPLKIHNKIVGSIVGLYFFSSKDSENWQNGEQSQIL